MTEEPRFLGAPIYSLQTMLRQISSENQAVLPLIPDGFYGPNTYASVRSLQQYAGLPITGNTDSTTWQAIIREYNAQLPGSGLQYHPGDPSPIFPSDLHILQATLLAVSKQYTGNDTPQVTGELDMKTKETLRWIQQVSGLEASGMPDIRTQNALNGIFHNSLIK